MLGKQMPGIGIEKLLDKSVTGAFLMRTFGAEKRILLEDSAEHAQKNVRSFLMTHGELLEISTLGEHAQLAGLVCLPELNPAVLLVNFGEKDGKTEVSVRAYAKEGMQGQGSAVRALTQMENFLRGDDGVLDAILKEFG